MLLVGSLSFFLLQVFYRGAMAGSVRWVLFWYVIAIVLVTRIGIEQGSAQATIYGLGLAAVTWLYLVRTHPAYLLGLLLLGGAWWCARRLTIDCTIDEEEAEQAGQGVLSGTWSLKKATRPARSTGANKLEKRRETKRPGVSVVYFSLAALPLFGLGQVLLPRNDTASRRFGFGLLVVYLAAALGLLLITSFSGLRAYLRRRYLRMTPAIAFGWIRAGLMIGIVVLAGALFLPRPGAHYSWRTLSQQIDSKLQRASEYATQLNKPGSGRGRPGSEGGDGRQRGAGDSAGSGKGNAGSTREPRGGAPPGEANNATGGTQTTPSAGASSNSAEKLHSLFRILAITAAIIAALWLVVRNRAALMEMLRSVIAALARWFGEMRIPRTASQKTDSKRRARSRPEFPNPFLTGKDQVWPPERLILYTQEALVAWAKEQGVRLRPQQTQREICLELAGQFPEAESEFGRLSYFYAHAAFGRRLPSDYESEPVRRLWQLFTKA